MKIPRRKLIKNHFPALEGYQQKPHFEVSMPRTMRVAIDSAYSMYCGAVGK